MHMPRRPVRAKPDHHARMLDRLVAVIKLSADRAHILPLGVHQKLLHPVDRDHLRVVV